MMFCGQRQLFLFITLCVHTSKTCIYVAAVCLESLVIGDDSNLNFSVVIKAPTQEEKPNVYHQRRNETAFEMSTDINQCSLPYRGTARCK